MKCITRACRTTWMFGIANRWKNGFRYRPHIKLTPDFQYFEGFNYRYFFAKKKNKQKRHPQYQRIVQVGA